MNFRKHWDRWVWLVPAVVILIGAARLFFGREPFCAVSKEEHCLREWVSAFGGWAAVAAAVPTVLFLAKQVADAEKFARATVRMNSVPAIEHARHIADLAQRLKNHVSSGRTALGALPTGNGEQDLRELTVRAKVAQNTLARKELQDASREFQTSHTSSLLVELLDMDVTPLTQLAEEMVPEKEHIAVCRDSVLKTYEMIESFSKELSERAVERRRMFEKILDP
ncbi:hypothetical protein [Ensifer sp. LBL]|uniref:hypothetical protein n=1 Tax=Ensifer sp. LBL TaxID=2991056 RepID=UPI003D1E9AB7